MPFAMFDEDQTNHGSAKVKHHKLRTLLGFSFQENQACNVKSPQPRVIIWWFHCKYRIIIINLYSANANCNNRTAPPTSHSTKPYLYSPVHCQFDHLNGIRYESGQPFNLTNALLVPFLYKTSRQIFSPVFHIQIGIEKVRLI